MLLSVASCSRVVTIEGPGSHYPSQRKVLERYDGTSLNSIAAMGFTKRTILYFYKVAHPAASFAHFTVIVAKFEAKQSSGPQAIIASVPVPTVMGDVVAAMDAAFRFATYAARSGIACGSVPRRKRQVPR